MDFLLPNHVGKQVHEVEKLPCATELVKASQNTWFFEGHLSGSAGWASNS